MAEDQQERQTDLWSAYAAEGISSTSQSDRDQEIRELRQQVQDLTGVLELVERCEIIVEFLARSGSLDCSLWLSLSGTFQNLPRFLGSLQTI